MKRILELADEIERPGTVWIALSQNTAALLRAYAELEDAVAEYKKKTETDGPRCRLNRWSAWSDVEKSLAKIQELTNDQ